VLLSSFVSANFGIIEQSILLCKCIKFVLHEIVVQDGLFLLSINCCSYLPFVAWLTVTMDCSCGCRSCSSSSAKPRSVVCQFAVGEIRVTTSDHQKINYVIHRQKSIEMDSSHLLHVCREISSVLCSLITLVANRYWVIIIFIKIVFDFVYFLLSMQQVLSSTLPRVVGA